MGTNLENVLEKLKDFRDEAEYFLQCIGYTATDIENMIGDVEQKLREANESN